MVFHAEGFALDDDGFRAVEDAVEDGGGDAGVVVKVYCVSVNVPFGPGG